MLRSICSTLLGSTTPAARRFAVRAAVLAVGIAPIGACAPETALGPTRRPAAIGVPSPYSTVAPADVTTPMLPPAPRDTSSGQTATSTSCGGTQGWGC